MLQIFSGRARAPLHYGSALSPWVPCAHLATAHQYGQRLKRPYLQLLAGMSTLPALLFDPSECKCVAAVTEMSSMLLSQILGLLVYCCVGAWYKRERMGAQVPTICHALDSLAMSHHLLNDPALDVDPACGRAFPSVCDLSLFVCQGVEMIPHIDTICALVECTKTSIWGGEDGMGGVFNRARGVGDDGL